ncbi:hypothetical protein PybrP1_002560 [[Pythium] brassicae (nom. inval.)]|nr:hypothetical protein PybrP1_002560 [[Pythium] brassicae (nom. inval.)]
MAARSPPGGRGMRADSADSDDSGFGDDSLSEDEYVQRRLQKMNTLMGGVSNDRIDEELAPLGATTSATSSSSSAPAGGGLTAPARSALERLQALALDAPLSAASAGANGGSSFFDDAGGADALLPPPFAFGDDDDDDDDDMEDDAYVITWEGGQLGLLFKASPAQQVVIRRVNKKGTALGLHLARAGDVLVGLNGVSVQGVPFLDIIEQLKSPRFPLKLEFEPIKLSALPFGLASVGGAPLPPPPPYAFSSSSSSAAAPFPGPLSQQQQVASPTSSVGTIDMMDQDVSFATMSQAGVSASVAPSAVADRARNEYDVVWNDGPLGCGLKQRNGFPAVKTMSTLGVSASVAQIRAGDVLLVINGYRTHEIGFKSAITMLQRAPKPIYLRFRRQSAPATAPLLAATNEARRDPAAATLAPRQYSVLWSDGPLGIQIKAGSGDGRVYVSRLTGAGSPAMTAQITAGDIFVRIADVDVASRGIAGAFELLKNVQKPVLLVFQKPDKVAAAGPGPRASTVPESSGGNSGSEPLPSFRRLREDAAEREKQAMAAAQPQGLVRTHSAGSQGNGRHLLHPHDGGFSGDGNVWQTRTAPYPSNAASSVDESLRVQKPLELSPRSFDLKFDFDDTSDAGSQQSNARTEPSLVAGGGALSAPGDDAYIDLPRFSDIEAGRVVVAPELAGLPPPPSYLDMFTESGRQLDAFIAAKTTPESLPLSDSFSMASESRMDRFAAPSRLPPQETDSFAALPPPPPHYSSFYQPPPPDSVSRLEELRQQYIEAQRAHNQPQFSSTMMSSYSDLDDSGVMRERPSASRIGAPRALQPLPLPELWVRWSDGPLGITFKRKNGRIVVSRLTGAGLSPGLEQLRTGDWLVSFNNQSTDSLRLSETMELLKRLPKPVDMRFVVQ